ncbi:MAG: GGDEF domain-containing protein [Alphaproteobacteria bacterium]|nr:GGDEF domain-containing protein [Alphaproteobacteria bacterium]
MSSTSQTNGSDKTAVPADAKAPVDRTHEIAVQALEKIETLDLKPIPQIYELWFRYFQGDPEIVRAIDTHTGKIDEVVCHKIYKRFLSDSARDEAVRKISDEIQQSMSDMMSMLGNVKSATNEYGDTLTDVNKKVKSANSIEDLGQIVSSIVQDTKKMLQKNQELELQLVNSSQQVTELRKNLDTVKKEAMTDGLTGLHNRKAFDKHIRDCVEDSTTSKDPLSLLMLDIDHFKTFNDTYGHQIGDQVLRLVAHTLVDGIKGRDIAARYGGEEFSIILPNTPASAAMKVAEMLRKNIENKDVVNKANQQHLGQITLSIGVAEFKPGESASDFIARADQALYTAKHEGRNRVHQN